MFNAGAIYNAHHDEGGSSVPEGLTRTLLAWQSSVSSGHGSGYRGKWNRVSQLGWQMTLGPLPSVTVVSEETWMMPKGEGPHGRHTGSSPACAFLCLSKRGTRLEIGSGNSSNPALWRRGWMGPGGQESRDEASKEASVDGSMGCDWTGRELCLVELTVLSKSREAGG